MKKILEILIRNKGDINGENGEALSYSIKENDYYDVKDLLELGATVEIPNHISLLTEAVIMGNFDILKLLISYSQHGIDWESLYRTATDYHHEDITKFLYDKIDREKEYNDWYRDLNKVRINPTPHDAISSIGFKELDIDYARLDYNSNPVGHSIKGTTKKHLKESIENSQKKIGFHKIEIRILEKEVEKLADSMVGHENEIKKRDRKIKEYLKRYYQEDE